ncbi:MAG TPA: holo-ACP synthase [Steroidobacteraceae bacterium]|nr:holo-ACP synthase [Steroidobacteraceae bacterium]
MIFGIGTDLVEVARIAASHRRFGRHFIERLLMPEELARFERLPATEGRAVRFLSQRFAAKEAIVKALGTGFAHGVWIRDCGVVQNAWGRPEVVWSTRGAAVAAKLGAGAGHVTLTDEGGFVLAVAVLERAAPAGGPA